MLALVVPLYGRLVAKYARMKLINVVTVFFAVCPVIFYVLAQFGVPLAVVFFVWIGIFSLMIIAQFWAFANDVYTKEEGERLFVIVGFGASLGAVGWRTHRRSADRAVGGLPTDAARRGDPVGSALVDQLRQQARKRTPPAGGGQVSAPTAAKPSGSNAFAMVFRTRYLLLIALMLMLVNWVNTTGEYILGSIVKDTAVQPCRRRVRAAV